MHGVLLLMLCFIYFFRSSSIDSAPLVTSSETLPEVNAKKDTAFVAEQKVEELPPPAVVKPPQTSPDLNFASEVAV